MNTTLGFDEEEEEEGEEEEEDAAADASSERDSMAEPAVATVASARSCAAGTKSPSAPLWWPPVLRVRLRAAAEAAAEDAEEVEETEEVTPSSAA